MLLLSALCQALPVEAVFLTNNIDRPLRYTPVGTDFVITNGAEFFNRPLYGGSAPFRVDGGDKPEFSLYLPGRGGNLRLGLKVGENIKWLNDATQVVTLYRPGSIIHEVRDPLLGDGVLRLTTLATHEVEGMILRAELEGKNSGVELVWAFGGVNGLKGQRNGDIGCEAEPVGQFFQLQPEQCAGNTVTISEKNFRISGKPGTIGGVASVPAKMQVADVGNWSQPKDIFTASSKDVPPLLAGRVALKAGEPFYLALERLTDAAPVVSERLPELFAKEEATRRAIAERVVVETPDPFINASVAALNLAADAIWDDAQQSFMHGAVAWRSRLLGWRGPFAGDALGWHERTAAHFTGYARQQNTNLISETMPPPEESANLARNENALHSQGDLMSRSHYDMNLLAVDAFFRHLLWTGDLDFARTNWPVITRHLAWERRLFRREFGPDKLPLYEGYAAIWASDDLAYDGGGATHASALNFYANKMAAQVARLIGEDATPYEREADLILRAMQKFLWLPGAGSFAEFKDYLGLQLPHPNAALWTFYHTLDSEVPTPDEAAQMAAWVEKNLAHIPIQTKNQNSKNENYFVLPTTGWLPYQWSLNNVVVAENAHAALGFWQANRAETAYSLLKGTLLETMFGGLCPGNVGCMTAHDVVRGEAQRDFGDGIGALSRAVVEGLFGVQPDLLAGEIKIHPGFPAEWNHARIMHPDFSFAFHRDGLREIFSLETKFAAPQKLRLQIPALRDSVASVTVNGQPATWQLVENSVGTPRIEIIAPVAKKQEVVIEWRGKILPLADVEIVVAQNAELHADVRAKILELSDPQNALSGAEFDGSSLRGVAAGASGHRAIFAKMQQGDLRWWQPVMFEIRADPVLSVPMDWSAPISATLDSVNLATNFNDCVTQIFRNEYLAPRSPFCSLATPKQGIGSWCHPNEKFAVDDAGLRVAAAKSGGKIVLPNGVPLATPGAAGAKNIAFVSQWENYPREISVALTGKSSHAFLLMAGSTSAMQSRFDNGEVIATYADGSSARLVLRNPTTWWPIDQDYYFDDFAFRQNPAGETPVPLPVRVDLATGKIRVLKLEEFKGRGHTISGGAATVLDLPLDATRELKSLTVRALANEVVIGLMSVTLQR